MDNLSPEIRLVGPALIFLGSLISIVGIGINFYVALNEYETSSYNDRPLY